ncbi:purine-nucleoside phosphorylase [Parasporobacterium paucivorans]|uniref:Purine nucleoside phosphorylase n=1 Tax=Parasporobacterium paucivorans DSM 15970 TaxID=1122934 RepID=A0A1M6D3L8_9FIRM|nr:purine-nucleoside phosphorylase [Parasporobacterium paucivorans]SHI67847.1 purine-nucleoside phosphorylase [Parasporobacterium paucivorans DSM 15970]
MNKIYEKLVSCYESVRKITDFVPETALILGSGLGDYADSIQVECEIDYHDIEGFPVSTVLGHEGKFIFGHVNDVPVVCMKGRVHYYEGYPISDVVLPIRLMKLLGAKVLFLTNASGGINPEFNPGELMIVTDHISCFVPNPLLGENIEELGTRFPDMSDIYNKEMRNIIQASAEKLGIGIREGIYVQLTGPSYESPAEIKMLGALGADAVGMSTAVEAIAGNHMGMKVCCISCVSNLAAGISKAPLSHKEVQEAANIAAPNFKKLVSECIAAFSRN